MTAVDRVLPILLCGALSTGVAAQTLPTYDGCVAADGTPVRAVLDSGQAAVVATRHDTGRAVIAYNPQVLPRLAPPARLFLFAHECARHHLGLDTTREADPGEARRADCEAVAMLERSGLADPGRRDTLEAQLQLAPEEWRYVPGPRREFALRSCGADVQPLLGRATPQWNACVRACGEPLRECRQACRGDACEACETRYGHCTSLCDFRFSQ